MSRSRIVFAICVSVALVSGATWFRFAQATEYYANLVSLDRLEQDYLLADMSDDFISDTTLSEDPEEPLSQTDIISRQLFSDYIALKSQGQVTPTNLKTLAEKYASQITRTENLVYVDRSQIAVVPDSDNALQNYGETILKTRSKYGNLINNLTDQTKFDNIFDPEFKSFMISVADLYDNATEDLKNLPTPNSLADNHVKLINNYLSSARVSRALANIDQNPIGAYAALNMQAKNSEEEATLFSNIQITLLSKSILLKPNGI